MRDHTKLIREQSPAPLVDLALYDMGEPKRKAPAWIQSDPIVQVGAWEPLFFRRRFGNDVGAGNNEQNFAYEHSEDFVKEVKRIGANLIVSSFEKNYRVDAADFPLKKRLAAYCRKHGLRISYYIRPAECDCEAFPDAPGGKGGWARTADGRTACYAMDQDWLRNVCLHNPEVFEELKKLIRTAIVDLHADMIHFDGFSFGGLEGTDACRCEKCRADFTDFLQRRYGKNPKMAKERFGHTALKNIEPPGMIALPAIPQGPITRPDWQEWISFRCTWSVMFARIIADYVYKLNPEVAICINNAPAVKENMPMLLGEAPPLFNAIADCLFCEDAYVPAVTKDGIITHRVRQMKMSRPMDAFLLSYVDRGQDLSTAREKRTLRTNLAFEAAFNRGRIPHIGYSPYLYTPDFHNGYDEKRGFISWVNHHWDLYQGLETAHDFTVWRSERGLAFAEHPAYAAFVQTEQLLVEERIPFEIAFDECLDRLTAEDVLLVPDIACITAAQGNRIIRLVRSGGGLLIGRNTSCYDGWYRKRPSPLFKALMEGAACTVKKGAMKHIAHAGAVVGFEDAGSFAGDIRYFRSGKGRVVHVPSIVDAASQPPLLTAQGGYNFALDYTNWRVPEHAEEILSALTWLKGGRYQFKVDAPRGVIAEYYRQPAHKRYFVHLVNLGAAKDARNVVIRFNGRPGERVRNVGIFSPDSGAAGRFDVTTDAAGTTVTLDLLDTYTIVAIALQGTKLR